MGNIKLTLPILRAHANLTQTQAAKIMGVSLPTYRRMEEGTMFPSVVAVYDLAVACEVFPEDICWDIWWSTLRREV